MDTLHANQRIFIIEIIKMTSPNRYSPNTVLFITVNLLVKKCQVRKKKDGGGILGKMKKRKREENWCSARENL